MEPSPLDGIVTLVAEIVKLGVAACAGELSSTAANPRTQTKRKTHRLFMAHRLTFCLGDIWGDLATAYWPRVSPVEL
jgi:hypothetical protein